MLLKINKNKWRERDWDRNTTQQFGCFCFEKKTHGNMLIGYFINSHFKRAKNTGPTTIVISSLPTHFDVKISTWRISRFKKSGQNQDIELNRENSQHFEGILPIFVVKNKQVLNPSWKMWIFVWRWNHFFILSCFFFFSKMNPKLFNLLPCSKGSTKNINSFWIWACIDGNQIMKINQKSGSILIKTVQLIGLVMWTKWNNTQQQQRQKLKLLY